MSVVNGAQEIQTTQTRWYKLHPTHAGKLKITEARVIVDGVEYKTKPILVDVAPGGADPGQPGNDLSGPDPSYAAKPTFLYAIVDKKHAWVGEQVTVTWQLYTRSDIVKFDPKPPKLDGFWVETLFEPTGYFNYHEETVGGREYAVAVVSKRALFANKAGKMTIPPFEADAQTLYTSFNSPLRMKSPEIPLDIEALPAGGPAGFDPAYIGNFEVEASVDRNTIAAGESLTLSLVVRGQGAIRRAKIPPLDLDGYQLTPPHDYDERIDTSSDTFKGERHYSYLRFHARKAPRRQAEPRPVRDPVLRPGHREVLGRPRRRDPDRGPRRSGGAGGKAKGSQGSVSTDNVIGRDIPPAARGASGGLAGRGPLLSIEGVPGRAGGASDPRCPHRPR